PTHGDEIVRGDESATQPARTVVVVPIPPELIGERRDEFHAVLFRRESVDGPLLVGDLVFRSLYGDEGDVRRIRAVRTEGPLEDEVIPTRERGMVWDERAIDDFLQESSRCRERGERVRDRLRRLRFRDDPEGRLRDDAQRSFRAEEERREVRELAARVRLRSGLEQAPVRQDYLEPGDRVPQAPAAGGAEAGAPGVDRAAQRAPDRVHRDDRKGEAFRLDEILE